MKSTRFIGNARRAWLVAISSSVSSQRALTVQYTQCYSMDSRTVFPAVPLLRRIFPFLGPHFAHPAAWRTSVLWQREMRCLANFVWKAFAVTAFLSIRFCHLLSAADPVKAILGVYNSQCFPGLPCLNIAILERLDRFFMPCFSIDDA